MFNDISELQKKYELVLKDIENEFENSVFFENHIKSTKIVKFVDNNVYILVANDFIKETLLDYVDLFDECLARHFNLTLNTIFITDVEKTINVDPYVKVKSKTKNTNLNKDLTFDNLVVGNFNESAVKACKMMLDYKSSWSCLFIYGGTGLGKTHILNAIGNKFKDLFQDKNVLYLETETFYRNVYSAISKGGIEIEKYKDGFNDIDLLLVDDIQFLSNKEKMNEIFFTIFNKFISEKRYIVMTSDKIPNSLTLDDRMISRFNSGLQLKIGVPELEAVKKIVIMKLESSNRKNQFSMGAIDFLVSRFHADIRVLEGILNKIIFHSMIEMNPDEIINEQKIKKIIENDSEFDYISKNLTVNPQIIIETVCIAYNVDLKSVISAKRNQELSFPRKVCMYILREKLGLSFSQIGKSFSNRNHSTVMESVKQIEKKIIEDEDFKIFLENLMAKL